MSVANNAAPIRELVFSRDNRMLASASNGDGAVCVWDLGTQSVRHHLAGHVQAAASIAFSADGKMLATW